MENMREIAIVQIYELTQSGDWDNSIGSYIASHITEWTKVSESDFELLRRGMSDINYRYGSRNSKANHWLIEKPSVKEQEEYILKTVADYKKVLQKEKEAMEARAAAEAERKRIREEKKAAKAAKNRDALVESLQKQLEELKKQK